MSSLGGGVHAGVLGRQEQRRRRARAARSPASCCASSAAAEIGGGDSNRTAAIGELEVLAGQRTSSPDVRQARRLTEAHSVATRTLRQAFVRATIVTHVPPRCPFLRQPGPRQGSLP